MRNYQNNDNCCKRTLSIYLFHIPNPLSYFDNLYSAFNLRCLFLKMKLRREKKKEKKRKTHITVKKDGFSLEQ